MDELSLVACDKDKARAQNLPVYDLDLDFIAGRVPQLAGQAAELQRAYTACYTKLGSIPLQEDKGIAWTAFKNGAKPYNEIVCDLNKNISTFIGAGKYAPIFTKAQNEMQFKLMRMR
jgi:hypothetical protein